MLELYVGFNIKLLGFEVINKICWMVFIFDWIIYIFLLVKFFVFVLSYSCEICEVEKLFNFLIYWILFLVLWILFVLVSCLRLVNVVFDLSEYVLFWKLKEIFGLFCDVKLVVL